VTNMFSDINTEDGEAKNTRKIKTDKREKLCELFRKQLRVLKRYQQVEKDPSGNHQTMFTKTRDLISSEGPPKRIFFEKRKQHVHCRKQANAIKCVLNVSCSTQYMSIVRHAKQLKKLL